LEKKEEKKQSVSKREETRRSGGRIVESKKKGSNPSLPASFFLSFRAVIASRAPQRVVSDSTPVIHMACSLLAGG